MEHFRRRARAIRRLLMPWIFWLMLVSLLANLVCDTMAIVEAF
jgi:hypothetical protein